MKKILVSIALVVFITKAFSQSGTAISALPSVSTSQAGNVTSGALVPIVQTNNASGLTTYRATIAQIGAAIAVTGPTGATGPTGDAGADGATGATGATGADGSGNSFIDSNAVGIFVKDTTQKFGIGTAYPSSKLEVFGGAINGYANSNTKALISAYGLFTNNDLLGLANYSDSGLYYMHLAGNAFSVRHIIGNSPLSPQFYAIRSDITWDDDRFTTNNFFELQQRANTRFQCGVYSSNTNDTTEGQGELSIFDQALGHDVLALQYLRPYDNAYFTTSLYDTAHSYALEKMDQNYINRNFENNLQNLTGSSIYSFTNNHKGLHIVNNAVSFDSAVVFSNTDSATIYALPSPAMGATYYCTDCTPTDNSAGGVKVCYNGSLWRREW
jgi:hypothetical protein